MGTEGVELRLLGSTEAWHGGVRLDLGPAKRRTLLAALAIAPGHVVPFEVLIDRIWGESPPPDPRNAIYSYAARLRKTFQPAGVGIVHRDGGYACELSAADVDVARFRATNARKEAAADDLRDALSLWRGIPLADLNGEWAQRVRAALEQERLTVRLRLAAAESEEGRLPGLVDDLRAWLADDPLSEPLAGHLVQALATAGRRAEALEQYAATRAYLVEELGEEPGAELQQLHLRLLREAPEPADEDAAEGTRTQTSHQDEVTEPASARATPPLGTPPRQLPGVPGNLVGRDDELDRVLAAVDGPARAVAIYGPGGVGKSALALWAAHQAAERFADGQVYADLAGASVGSRPLSSLEVLRRFLRALGTSPNALPTELPEAESRFRSLTADRRLLFVLDNVADVSQARPLLPAGSGCAVLMTSRTALTTIDDAVHVALDVLSDDAAGELLDRFDGGAGRVRDRVVGPALVRLCGGLPLALRIVGARLAARPARPLAAFVQRLEDRRRALDELAYADLDVRACFEVSYRALADADSELDRRAALVFRRIALLDGQDVSLPMAARLLDRSEADTEDALERLQDAQLVRGEAPGRYRLHDLIHSYAREVAEEVDPVGERLATLERGWRGLTATAATARALIHPVEGDVDVPADSPLVELEDASAAYRWFGAESNGIVAAIRQLTLDTDVGTGPGSAAGSGPHSAAGSGPHSAADSGPDSAAENGVGTARVALPGGVRELAVPLTTAVTGYLRLAPSRVSVELIERVLPIVRAARDRSAEPALLRELGNACLNLGDPTAAAGHYRAALDQLAAADRPADEARTLNNLGGVLSQLGETAEAVEVLERGIVRARRAEAAYPELLCRTTLAALWGRLGRDQDAAAAFEEILPAWRQNGDVGTEAMVTVNLALALCEAGQPERAVQEAERGVHGYRELGLSAGVYRGLTVLAEAYLRLGALADALERFDEARRLESDQVDPYFVISQCGWHAHALRLAGRLDEAIERCEHGLALSVTHRYPLEEARVMWRYGEALADTGRRERARWFLREAHRRLDEAGAADAGHVGQVLAALAGRSADTGATTGITPHRQGC